MLLKAKQKKIPKTSPRLKANICQSPLDIYLRIQYPWKTKRVTPLSPCSPNTLVAASLSSLLLPPHHHHPTSQLCRPLVLLAVWPWPTLSLTDWQPGSLLSLSLSEVLCTLQRTWERSCTDWSIIVCSYLTLLKRHSKLTQENGWEYSKEKYNLQRMLLNIHNFCVILQI